LRSRIDERTRALREVVLGRHARSACADQIRSASRQSAGFALAIWISHSVAVHGG
jgi:hypothetical protein